MLLSEAGLMPSELREEPSGLLALLSIVEFLKAQLLSPPLLPKQLFAALAITLTLEGGESGVFSAGPSGVF